MTRDELLASLLVERYTNPWWATPAPEAADDDLACRRRLNAAVTESDAMERPTKAVG